MSEANAPAATGQATPDAGTTPQSNATTPVPAVTPAAGSTVLTETPETKAAAEKAATDAKAARAAELAKMSPGDRLKAEADDKAKADAEAKAKQSAPEKYTDFNMAEGTTLDAEVMGEFQGVAKELNLSQDQAQRLVDLANKMSLKQNSQLATTVEKAKGEWAEAAKADKEFGGDVFDQNLSVAKKAIDAFATPELKTLLNESGLGNHPEIIRHFFRVGKAISEDGHITGSKGHPAATGDRDAQIAQQLYGATQKPN